MATNPRPPLIPEAPLGGPAAFNPQMMHPGQLRAIFVARQHQLAQLVDHIRALRPGATPQHLLVTGHRGMGKSTLLHRLALAISEDDDLRKGWVALTFPEEQYTVGTLGEFWVNVLDALADTLEREGVPVVALDQLDNGIRALDGLPDADKEKAAVELLTQWIAANGRRVVVLVDSTDLLFAALVGEGRSAAGQEVLWRLRKVLTHQPGIVWVGASYHALEAHQDYYSAFHDFFDLIELRPLTVAEMRDALLALARTFGAGHGQTAEQAEEAMRRNLDNRPERLKVLREMTGGNPRTTVILYDLFASDTRDNVHSDLRRLLDLMTPLYKARMENLADQPRKLLAHLMEHWHPMSARMLADASGVAGTTVTGQLKRLETEGLVEKTALPGTKSTGYLTTERLFNIWYLMRYAPRRMRQRLTWLVEFMRLWFSADEIVGLAHRRSKLHALGRLCDNDGLEFSRAVAACLPDGHAERLRLEWTVFSAADTAARRTRQDVAEVLRGLFDLDGDDKAFGDAATYRRRLAALDAGLRRLPHAEGAALEAWVEAVKGSTGLTLDDKEKVAQASADLSPLQYQNMTQVLTEERSKLGDMMGADSVAVLRRAIVDGDFFPDCPDGQIAYQQILACFDQDRSVRSETLALLMQKGNGVWAERACRDLLDAESSACNWYNLGCLLQAKQGCMSEAEQAYRQALVADPEMADAWNNLGNLLLLLDRPQEAEAAFRQAAKLAPGDATIWRNLAIALNGHFGCPQEAEEACRTALAIDEENPRTWNVLGSALANLGRTAEAEAAYRRVIAIDDEYYLGWCNLGSLLANRRECFDEAEAVLRRAIAINPEDPAAWTHLGRLLEDRPQEAEAAYRKVIQVDPTYIRAWNGLGDLLQDRLGRFEEAESAYGKAAKLDPTEPYTHCNLARLQVRLERKADAADNYRRAVLLVETKRREQPGMWEGGMWGNLLLQAHLYLGNRDLALRALDELAVGASGGDSRDFCAIGEQVRECHAMGIGGDLAALMEGSAYAAFLQPFSLALRCAQAENHELLLGAAPEVRSMAEAVLAELQPSGA